MYQICLGDAEPTERVERVLRDQITARRETELGWLSRERPRQIAEQMGTLGLALGPTLLTVADTTSRIQMVMADTDWTQVGMFVATVVALGVTIWATLLNPLLYRSQTDPDVIVYVATDESQGSLIYIAVENVGKALASDITFRWVPVVPSKAYGIDVNGSEPAEAIEDDHPLRAGIRELGPGAKRLYIWGQWGGITRSLQSTGGRLRLACEYTGGHRALIGQARRHRQDFTFEVHSLGETPNRASDVHRIADEAKRIADAIEHMDARVRYRETSRRRRLQQEMQRSSNGPPGS